MAYDFSRVHAAMTAAKRMWEERGRRGLDWLLAEYQTDPASSDEDLRNALLSLAIESRDLPAVRAFVDLGADLVTVAGEHLNGAAGAGDTAAVDELIALGADVNFCDGCGFSPLDSALDSLADSEALRMVAHLIARGADIECRCQHNGTALHSAAGFGKLEVVKFLLARGARAAVEDVDEATPRDIALLGVEHDWGRAPPDTYREIAALLLGPEMAERRGAGHPVEPEHVAEAAALVSIVEGRLARGEPCGDLPERYLDELRLRIEEHQRGEIKEYLLWSWYQLGRQALEKAGVPV